MYPFSALTLLGISVLISDVQFKNTNVPSCVIESGSSIDVKLMHPAKAPCAIVVILLPKLHADNDMQELNTSLPSFNIESGKFNSTIDEHALNTQSPMLETEFGMSMLERDAQYANALFLIAEIESGMYMLESYMQPDIAFSPIPVT